MLTKTLLELFVLDCNLFRPLHLLPKTLQRDLIVLPVSILASLESPPTHHVSKIQVRPCHC